MAVLTPINVTTAGATVTLAAANSTEEFAYPSNTRAVWYHIDNAGGGSINVTITSPVAASEGLAASDRVVAVGAGATKAIYIPALYTASDGSVDIALSGTTSVTAAVLYVAG